jgi:hypothetical protein
MTISVESWSRQPLSDSVGAEKQAVGIVIDWTRFSYLIWWRRRELNPRPRAVKPGYYMLVSPLVLVHVLPGERGVNVDQPLGFRRLRRDGSQTLSSP